MTINDQIDAFFANGGKVEQIETGKSGMINGRGKKELEEQRRAGRIGGAATGRINKAKAKGDL